MLPDPSISMEKANVSFLISTVLVSNVSLPLQSAPVIEYVPLKIS